jgi:uncharacterized SAM-binding protein YcdF (DUF218 family)
MARLSRRTRIGLVALALLGGLWLAATLAVDAYGQVDRAQPADVIVVLGTHVAADGGPSPGLARRADHAAALYRRGLAAAIICTGGPAAGLPSEAAVACARIAAHGVPDGALIREERSRSTEENAREAAALMQARGWRRAILVSDGFHLYRAERLFGAAGVTAYGSPAQATAGPMAPHERLPRAAREVLALAWYALKTALGIPLSDVPCAFC